MLYIELTPLSNGAHNNQRTDDPFPMPEGWSVVPPELEEEAWGYLPFIDLTVENGQIVTVAQGVVPPPEPFVHTVTEQEFEQQNITDLELDMIEQQQTITDLELALLAK